MTRVTRVLSLGTGVRGVARSAAVAQPRDGRLLITVVDQTRAVIPERGRDGHRASTTPRRP